jgi:hypothetical protein
MVDGLPLLAVVEPGGLVVEAQRHAGGQRRLEAAAVRRRADERRPGGGRVEVVDRHAGRHDGRDGARVGLDARGRGRRGRRGDRGR